MQKRAQQSAEKREVVLTCFTCHKESTVYLSPWQENKKLTCPKCNGKEAIIGTKFFNNL
jgi:Zn finger protein HypA/HybF involved in hydrogenase expression